MVAMQVISAWNASTWRSNMILKCSSTVRGRHWRLGQLQIGRNRVLPIFECAARASSRYSFDLLRSDRAGPSARMRPGPSRSPADCGSVACRKDHFPSPNNFSNTTCGLFSIGSGVVWRFQNRVGYAQAKPAPQLKATSSIESSRDGSGVILSTSFTRSDRWWSRRGSLSPDARRSNTAAERAWSDPRRPNRRRPPLDGPGWSRW